MSLDLVQLRAALGNSTQSQLHREPKSICLVIPPSPFLLDERVFASLGILKVAAILEKDYNVSVLDLSGVENYLDAVRDCPDADFFGITATTPQMPAAMEIGRTLHRGRSARTILGGPHVTLVHAAAREEAKQRRVNGRSTQALATLADAFDVLVPGDGEKAIFLALQPDAAKIIDGDDPAGGLFLSHDDFTASPWPARHLIDLESYHYTIDGHKATSLISQLGCPFQCTFCAGRLSPMLRKIRLRDTANIIAELRYLYTRYGYTGFMFYDDELNVNKQMVPLMRQIVQLQKELGTSFALRGFVKAELFNDEQAAVMREAGFTWLLCGFESGSPKILRNIRKQATTLENAAMLQTAHRHGIKVKALMSVGHAGESEQTIRETSDWLMAERPDEFDATVITVYPGSPYYDQAVHLRDDIWKFEIHGDFLYYHDLDFTQEQAFYKGIPGEYKAFVFTDHLTSEELVKLRDNLEANVRAELGIPYQTGGSAQRYEHSMGMGLPLSIFRTQSTHKVNQPPPLALAI
ncbi:MAG: B12-binding domain-containing radical SAM protein [Bryobacteraceae bacterium]|nr:B12-binding domain-containing radical SAM protein [Bryobacteraceae bacterium]